MISTISISQAGIGKFKIGTSLDTYTELTNAKKVTKIELEIGLLAGVELESLNFVWDSAIKESVLEFAEKEFTIIKGIGKCIDCDTEFDMEYIYDSCPKCNSNFKGILQGKTLSVVKPKWRSLWTSRVSYL